jgi:hypothetical protein
MRTKVLCSRLNVNSRRASERIGLGRYAAQDDKAGKDRCREKNGTHDVPPEVKRKDRCPMQRLVPSAFKYSISEK